MRKLLISLMIFVFVLGSVACSVNENNSTHSVDRSGLQDESIGVKDEGEVPSKMTHFAFSPQNAGVSYSCTVLWHSDNQVFGHTEKVVVRDATQKEVQTIFPEENEMLLSSQDLLYFMDVTFDGYTDMLIPTSYSARYRAFMVYRWDNGQEQFVRVPTLLLEPAVDEKAKVIRTYTAGSQIASYSVHVYDAEVGDYVCQSSLYFEPLDHLSEDSLMRLVVEEEGKEREFTVAGEAYRLDVNDKVVAPYYADGSYWDLDSDKWNMTACFWR